MKKLIALLCAVALVGTLRAQNSVKVIPQSIQLEDVVDVLDMNNIYIHRFDLQPLLDTHYNITFYVDEYRHAEKQGRVHSFLFGPNIGSVTEYPVEQWEAIRQEYHLAPGENEYDRIKTVTLTLQVKDDSLATVSVGSPGVGRMSKSSLKLYPVEGYTQAVNYMYDSRPFRLESVTDGDTVEIPLVFFGSWWYDKRSNFIRFCGESEIDPQLQSQIVKDVPHSYVIGMRLEKMPKKTSTE